MVTGAGRASRDINAIAPLAPNAWLRYDLVERMLPAGVTDVLEIGCGGGAFGARLAPRDRYGGAGPDAESFAIPQRRSPAPRPRPGLHVPPPEPRQEQFPPVRPP